MINNKIIKKISYLFVTITFMMVFTSCDTDTVADQSDIAIKKMGGTWVVDMTWDGDFYSSNTISTYNNSYNDNDVMWIDDLEHGWGLKTQVNADINALTFSGSNLDELYYGVTVNVTNGQIVKNGATTPTGDIVDSIYFEVEFSDIPGEIWIYSGYKSTAQVDDLP
ncbi:lipid-binding protein [Winogradskyella sp. PC D3.3]